MSERSVLGVHPLAAILAAVAIAVAVPAGAQTRAGDPARTAAYRARVETLAVRWRAASDAVTRAEAARRERAPGVPISEGVLRVTADSTLVSLVRGGSRAATQLIEATFGAEAAILTERQFIAERLARAERDDSVPVVRILRDGDPNGWTATTVVIGDAAETERQIAWAIGSAVAPLFHARLDSALQRWLRSPIPAHRESRDELEIAYIELATASTPGARRCLAGDLAGCREFLGLVLPDDPALNGLTPTLRRSLVGARPALRTSAAWAAYDRCMLEELDDACVVAARALPIEVIEAAISPTGARRSLARRAIAAGGADAFTRLRRSTSLPIDARLAAAAGQPADSLVAVWRDAVLAARPTSLQVTPGIAVMTVLWTLAVSAIALGSSRWR